MFIVVTYDSSLFSVVFSFCKEENLKLRDFFKPPKVQLFKKSQ